MSDDNFAADMNGNILPVSSDEVNETVRRMIYEGDLIAAIFMKDGCLGIQIFIPPSHELTEILKQTYETHAAIMKGRP